MDRSKLDELERYAMLIQKATGKSVRPYYKPFNEDGYVNMLNKYGTQKDSSEHYEFKREAPVSDSLLTEYYEGNGLFAKIIDTPAEEAVKHGFELEDVKDNDIINFYLEALDELDWDETCIQALKWTRLFGGCIAVLLVNDGRRLEEPLDFRSIESIDDIRLYERAIVTPDWNSINHYDPHEPFGHRGSRLGLPEWYYVNSKYGSFRVHDSRCLVFQNGVLPENTTSSEYQMWGVPEYLRIHRAIRDAEIAHGSAAKMLDRSIQAVYSMKNLASELATEEGESRVLRRMEVIDLARGLLNSIVIDNEGENYDFRQFQYSGVSQVIDSTCNFLSALTSIPQTILFGRSPAGMNSTGSSDLENYYNFVERMQKRIVKKNLRYLLSVLFEAGRHTGEVKEIPPIKIQFKSLWSQTEESKAALEIQRQQAQLTKAQIALTYIQAQVLDPTEVRRKLAETEEFDIETMLDDYTPEELEANQPQSGQQGGMTPEDLIGAEGAEGTEEEKQPEATEMAPSSAPTATKLPQDMSDTEKLALMHNKNDSRFDSETYPDKPSSVGVYVIKDGKILCGRRGLNDRTNGQLCGPGGTIEPNETVEHAAYRETEEEFGIEPKELIFIGNGKRERGSGYEPYLFICTEYDGEPRCLVDEMTEPQFLSIEEVLNEKKIFKPFLNGIDVLVGAISLNTDASDDEEGIWRTTDGGHKIHLNEKGEPDKGNPKVIEKMTGNEHSETTSKNLTNRAKTVILKKDDVQKLMQNGTISNKQNSRKQAAHIKGTPEYIAESKKRPLSVMTIDNSEIDKLVQDGLNGKSEVFCTIDKHGKKQYKMRVEADNVIGKYMSKDGTVSKESNKCTVHLSKNGYHAVPSK